MYVSKHDVSGCGLSRIVYTTRMYVFSFVYM